MQEKLCRICKETKPLSKFHKSKRHSSGVKNECAECTNEYLRKHYRKNYQGTEKFKRKNTNYHYKRKYGIEYNEYLQMCEERNNRCDICGIEKVSAGNQSRGSKDHLVLDHCHETGKIRGILCQECNQGIGLLKDNTQNFKNAIKYLEK